MMSQQKISYKNTNNGLMMSAYLNFPDDFDENNGMYRVNSKGKFNIPKGKFKTKPTIIDKSNIKPFTIHGQNLSI